WSSKYRRFHEVSGAFQISVCHGDGCFGDEFWDDFVFESVGVVIGSLPEPTGGQGDADAVETPGSIGVTHQRIFEAVGLLPGVVTIDDGADLFDEGIGVAEVR